VSSRSLESCSLEIVSSESVVGSTNEVGAYDSVGSANEIGAYDSVESTNEASDGMDVSTDCLILSNRRDPTAPAEHERSSSDRFSYKLYQGEEYINLYLYI
jgi:hypothetical protein